MTPQEIFNDLKSRIPSGASLKDALTTFILHFEKTVVDGCLKETGDDMLLFEWGGPYNWDSHFSVSLTRQFSHSDENGEYAGMEQLHMVCQYDPEEISVKSGNQWFEGADIQTFLTMVLESNVVRAIKGRDMKSIDWYLSDV